MAANLYPYGHLRENFRRDLKTVRRIAHKRSVWITEANVSTSGTYPVSAKRQASMIRYMYALAKQTGAKALIFHRLWSPYSPNPHDSGVFSWDGGQSALHIDGTPRRMYGVIGKLHSGYRPARLPRIPAAQIPPVTYSQFAPTQNTTAACPG